MLSGVFRCWTSYFAPGRDYCYKHADRNNMIARECILSVVKQRKLALVGGIILPSDAGRNAADIKYQIKGLLAVKIKPFG